ncbi:LysE family translocator [Rhizobiales bacterium]|uniref:LysE family translocator n=1 Tax=Hongsoonwoonella zoysiae TaxID=2821844 RepID=UPI001560C316|nr:LysE family translocator [Hongsoonwoonella zoysiae]NRG19685.1 LysE family translocator [Hongsoonwoonella zoysiae]
MDMTLYAVIGLMAVSFITPGPNNFIILNVAAKSGPVAALPLVLVIILGWLSLFGSAWFGVSRVLLETPFLNRALLLAGSAYLGFHSINLLFRDNGRYDQRPEKSPFVETAAGLALFQFLNPKGWVLAVTVAASVPNDGALALLLALTAAWISAASLLAWSVAGASLKVWLKGRRSRRAFDVVMGLSLAGFCVSIVVHQWP